VIDLVSGDVRVGASEDRLPGFCRREPVSPDAALEFDRQRPFTPRAPGRAPPAVAAPQRVDPDPIDEAVEVGGRIRRGRTPRDPTRIQDGGEANLLCKVVNGVAADAARARNRCNGGLERLPLRHREPASAHVQHPPTTGW
jgi:hypothetical protein